jgi:DNA polymerase sigma
MADMADMRENILTSLYLILRAEWTAPKWKVGLIPFGSSVSSLGARGSDLDICLILHKVSLFFSEI